MAILERREVSVLAQNTGSKKLNPIPIETEGTSLLEKVRLVRDPPLGNRHFTITRKGDGKSTKKSGDPHATPSLEEVTCNGCTSSVQRCTPFSDASTSTRRAYISGMAWEAAIFVGNGLQKSA